MDAKDIFVLSADTYFVLILERMADARPLETIPAIQSGLTKPTLGKRPLITIPHEGNLFLRCFLSSRANAFVGQTSTQMGYSMFRQRSHFTATWIEGDGAIIPKGHTITHIQHAMQVG